MLLGRVYALPTSLCLLHFMTSVQKILPRKHLGLRIILHDCDRAERSDPWAIAKLAQNSIAPSHN
jgi:hypothetical protein